MFSGRKIKVSLVLFFAVVSTCAFVIPPSSALSSWTVIETAHFPPARTGHAMAPLPDGRVLMFGGRGEDGVPLGDTWVLVPGPDEPDWVELHPAHSPDPRFGHSMVALPDGRVALFGGQAQNVSLRNDLWVFSNNDWQKLESGSPPKRWDHLAWAYKDSLYVYGGIGEPTEGRHPLYQDLWRYHFPTSTWIELEGPPDFISYNAVPLVVANKAYFVDPHSWKKTRGKTLVYDMNLELWEKVSWACMQWPSDSWWFAFTGLQVDGKVYALGGKRYYPDTHSETYTTEAWGFDVETKSCEQLEDLPYAISEAAGSSGPSRLDPFLVWGGKVSDDTLNDPSKMMVYSFP